MDCGTRFALLSPRDSFLWTVARGLLFFSPRDSFLWTVARGLLFFSPRDSFLWTVARGLLFFSPRDSYGLRNRIGALQSAIRFFCLLHSLCRLQNGIGIISPLVEFPNEQKKRTSKKDSLLHYLFYSTFFRIVPGKTAA